MKNYRNGSVVEEIKRGIRVAVGWGEGGEDRRDGEGEERKAKKDTNGDS